MDAFVEVSTVDVTGPEQGLTLSASANVWGFNYPTDEIGGGTTVEIFPLPTLPADYRQAIVDGVIAAWPQYNIKFVIFPGLVVVEIPQA